MQKQITGGTGGRKIHHLVQKTQQKGSCEVQDGLKGGEDSFSKHSTLCWQESHGEDLLWTKINAWKKKRKCQNLCQNVAQLLVIWGLVLQNIMSIEQLFSFLQEPYEETTAKRNEQSLILESGCKSGCGEVCLSECRVSDVLLLH